MTYDPNRTHDYPDRVVGYGADHHSSGYYAMLFAGVLAAMVAIFYLIGHVGGQRTEHANNPSETKATVGQATTERSEGPPTQSPEAQRR
jgi:hypothetical protein